ncbi:uncharacterized protein ASCRUDRAFT_73989, partial [Ascoidea rubescens DSM 1968]
MDLKVTSNFKFPPSPSNLNNNSDNISTTSSLVSTASSFFRNSISSSINDSHNHFDHNLNSNSDTNLNNFEMSNLNSTIYTDNSTHNSNYNDDENFSNENDFMINNNINHNHNHSLNNININTGQNSFKNKFSFFFYKLWYGPENPSDIPFKFNSYYLKKLDNLPFYFSNSLSKKFKINLLLIYLFGWLLIFSLILFQSLIKSPYYYDNNDKENIISFSCLNQKSIWKGKNSYCGINANLCSPFDNRDIIFKCPALCDRSSWTYSSIPVGDQDIKYRGFFIGGGKLPSQNTNNNDNDNDNNSDNDNDNDNNNDNNNLSLPYRADSYPCGAAVHAGVISPFFGGCAKLSFIGSQQNFPSTKAAFSSVDNSIPFNTFFPSSYIFKNLPALVSGCYDYRLSLLFINILLGLPIMFFCNGLLSFWIISITSFWTVLLSLDPPLTINPQDPDSLPSLISMGFQRLLPLGFVLYTLWHSSISKTLNNQTSPLAKLFIWYPLFWLGIMNNITFDRLPVDRLTIDDLKEQPGSIFAVGSIFLVIITCIFIQAYVLWKSGKFRKYLSIYFIFVIALIFLASLSGLTLRIHHYILGILLIPGTATKNLSAMLFQGILLGLLISGVARWNFASIVETSKALRRLDPSNIEDLKPPGFISFDKETKILSWQNVTKQKSNIIDGEIVSPDDMLDGYSLLINDIERYRGAEIAIDFEQLITTNSDLNLLVQKQLGKFTDDNGDISLYLRVGKATKKIDRLITGDYTKAGLLKWPSGNFVPPASGV